MTRAIFLLAALLSAGLAFARDTIGGVPRILDGDTVDLHGTHVCQSAFKTDPISASNIDPSLARVLG